MEVVLRIKGKEKTFVNSFISGRMLRKTIQMAKSMDINNIDEKDLDVLVDYVVELFDKQFTRDEFYDGIAADKLIPTVLDCILDVSGQTGKALEKNADPN